MNVLVRVAAAAVLMLGLQGCFFSPGKFDSTLAFGADGAFTFTYDGEIHFIALSDMASGRGEFEAEDCLDEDTFETRECTAEEIHEQRQAWESNRDNDVREAKEMAGLIGGLDASDPEAAEEFASRLRKQKGWRRVDYLGDGLFDVSYAITSYAGHGFAFPSVENFPMANDFVQFTPRGDGSIRIDAPGFGPNGANPMSQMMFGMSGLTPDKSEMPNLPEIDGTFTVRAPGTILANNTEDGPAATEIGNELAWAINSRTTAAPMALIRLAD